MVDKYIQLETDYKRLVPLLGKTNKNSLPPRVLNFQICLMCFTYTISHVADKHLHTADALSRAPVSTSDSTHVAEDRCTE